MCGGNVHSDTLGKQKSATEQFLKENVALTTDGKASAYKHGEVTIKHSSISVLSIDPEELPDESYGETNYELLSDEDFEVNKNLF